MNWKTLLALAALGGIAWYFARGRYPYVAQDGYTYDSATLRHLTGNSMSHEVLQDGSWQPRYTGLLLSDPKAVTANEALNAARDMISSSVKMPSVW